MTEVVKKKQKRGFAAIDPALQRKIASMGGLAAHEQGSAHEFTSEEARAAGRKGGLALKKKLQTEKEKMVRKFIEKVWK